MHIATKTLAAINDGLMIDQGSKYRGLLRKAMPLAEDAYSEAEDEFRSHLGASLIGRECGRELWYSFRWSTKKQFDGRMLRLFNRGHLEEPRFVALLQMIGCTVYQHDAKGKQFRIEGHKGHFGGSLDAVISGCPDFDGPILGEFKTHGEKSFLKLKSEGVLKSKWEHFVQMQIYMGKNQLPAAIYMAVNKNTDEIYAEIVMFDDGVYQRYLDRSVMIIDSSNPPPPLPNASAGWFACKFCDHIQVCHNPQAMPVRNCRTCAHSQIFSGATWACSVDCNSLVDIPKKKQLIGCDRYQINRGMKKP
jgi:hypothetical protein